MNTWKITTGGLMGICQCGNTEKKRRDWVKEETPLHKHEPPFSAAQPWRQEQGPPRLQHSRVPRPPVAPSPCRALASHDPAPSSRTPSCCHRLRGLGRGGSRQPRVPRQMGRRVPDSASRVRDLLGTSLLFSGSFISFLSAHFSYRQMSNTKHGQAWY